MTRKDDTIRDGRALIANARMHHTAMVYQRTMLRHPDSIVRNRIVCRKLRQVAREYVQALRKLKG